MENHTLSNDESKQLGSNDRVHPAIIATVSAVIGLVVGALGIYGLIKLIEKPYSRLDGPNPTGEHRFESLDSIELGFLKLEPESKNLIYSPLSIRYGLSLLSAGAKGTTKDEIDGLLTSARLPQYQNISDKLSLANAVFVRDSFKSKVLPEYTQTIQNDYSGEVIYDSFSSSRNMDAWVDRKTFGLINQIGIVPTVDTQMVLANALAIQMDWRHQFGTNSTHGSSFYLNDGSEIEATTMYQKTDASDVKYLIDDTTTAISLPLDSTTDDVDLEFIAIMPSGDLDEYIKKVNYSDLSSVVDQMTPINPQKDSAVISIPKFKFNYELDFTNDLMSLGVKTAFNEHAADFSGMATEPLYVSAATHNANIDFSEDGIKAAAITAFSLDAKSAEDEDEKHPVVININRPFLFIIRDTKNMDNWFIGTVYQPNLWKDDASSYKYH